MVGSLVSNEKFMIAYKLRTYRGLKIPLLEHIVIGYSRAIYCIVGMGGRDVLTRVEYTSISLVPKEDKGSGCVSKSIISAVGEPCEEGREAIEGVRSC